MKSLAGCLPRALSELLRYCAPWILLEWSFTRKIGRVTWIGAIFHLFEALQTRNRSGMCVCVSFLESSNLFRQLIVAWLTVQAWWRELTLSSKLFSGILVITEQDIRTVCRIVESTEKSSLSLSLPKERQSFFMSEIRAILAILSW